MDPASPLIFLLLSLVLIIGTAEGSATHSGFPAASSIITYVFAAILAAIGGGTLLYRRFQKQEGEGGVSWASVLAGAVGPDVAKVAGDLLSHGLWTVLLIFTIITTVFITSAFLPTSPLAWIGYAIIGVLSLVTLFTSPIVADMRGTGALGSLMAGLRRRFTSSVGIGAIIISAVLIAVLILGAAYPIVGWSTLGGLAMLTVYYLYRNANEWTPTLASWGRTVAGWFGAGAGQGAPAAGQPGDDIAQQIAEVQKLAGTSTPTTTAAATVVASALIITLAVYLPTIWKHWPSLRIGGNLGTELIPGPLPLATSLSAEIPGRALGWTARGGTGWGSSQGTSEYTIAWWQYINARAHGEAATALELGPAGQLLLGPGPRTATLALPTPAPQGAIEKVHLKLTPQRWQHVAVRASGDRTDVFLDGRLAGSSLRPPSAIHAGDILTMPGTVPRDTQGGIAKLTFSHRAEPFSAMVLAANTPPPV